MTSVGGGGDGGIKKNESRDLDSYNRDVGDLVRTLKPVPFSNRETKTGLESRDLDSYDQGRGRRCEETQISFRLIIQTTRQHNRHIMDGKPRTHYLPRLDREFYRGDAVVHWTLTVFNQGTGWLNESFHLKFRELLLHTAAREGLFCPVYCLMPDHLHLVWMGLRADSDQKNGMAFLRTHLEPLLSPHRFQPQPYDRVLRAEDRKRDAFAKVCFYILNNPVRSRLATEPAAWQFSGAILPGYPKLHPLGDDFWKKFWQLFAQAKEPAASQRQL